MFNLFKKKSVVKQDQESSKVSKGYHSCVDTCEKDIENLETECENLRKDNITLMTKVTALQTANKTLNEGLDAASVERKEQQEKLVEKDEQIETLEQRLKEADEKADGTPVKYASARKTLSKSKLKQLRERLESVPDGATGFGGSVSVYDKKTKRITLVEFKSKADALAVLDKAEKGNVEIIM